MRKTPTARNEDSPEYGAARAEIAGENALIARALEILASRLKVGDAMGSPSDVKAYVRLRIAALEYEVFGLLLLDAQHRVIEASEMFRGSLTQTSVYPREVVKTVLAKNAAAVILYHNHPSGSTDPSRADEHLTQTLKSALALVDVRVIDHIVVSQSGATSFAERGLL